MIVLLIIIAIELFVIGIDISYMREKIDKIGVMLAHFLDDMRGDNNA